MLDVVTGDNAIEALADQFPVGFAPPYIVHVNNGSRVHIRIRGIVLSEFLSCEGIDILDVGIGASADGSVERPYL
jgi:hypothetical protein